MGPEIDEEENNKVNLTFRKEILIKHLNLLSSRINTLSRLQFFVTVGL